MTMRTASLRVSASWDYPKTNTGFAPNKQRDTLSGSYNAVVATYQHGQIAQYTLAAAGTQTVDLYSLTAINGESATITKFKGLLLVATGTTGGQIKIEPGASNPFAMGFSGTTPALTLDVFTGLDTFFVLANGISMTVDNTHKNVKLSNPGSQSIVAAIFAMLGT